MKILTFVEHNRSTVILICVAFDSEQIYIYLHFLIN